MPRNLGGAHKVGVGNTDQLQSKMYALCRYTYVYEYMYVYILYSILYCVPGKCKICFFFSIQVYFVIYFFFCFTRLELSSIKGSTANWLVFNSLSIHFLYIHIYGMHVHIYIFFIHRIATPKFARQINENLKEIMEIMA